MKIVKKNKTYFFNLNNNVEAKQLEKYLNTELKIIPINDSTIVLSIDEKTTHNIDKINTQETTFDEIKNKIIEILLDKNFSINNKVEGIFEKFLKEKDIEIFKKMLEDKTITIFKRSDRYKKGIYVVNSNKMDEKRNKNTIKLDTNNLDENKFKIQEIKTITQEAIKKNSKEEENIDEIINDFYKKKYIIIKSQSVANVFSTKLYPKFKSNEIKGQKSFDNNFYAIDVLLYNEIRELILSSSLEKNFTLEELSNKLNKDINLLKITIEFLKEEGLLIEKRKNIFCII